MTGVIGFNIKKGRNLGGTIVIGYKIGVKYIHIIAIISKICCKSLRYTVKAELNMANPNARIYSTNMTGGRYKHATNEIRLPETRSTKKKQR